MKIEDFSGAVVLDKNKILLVQESHEQARGLWSLPLGHVEVGEPLSKAAIREVKEETGYDILLGKLEKTFFLNNKEFKSTEHFDDKKNRLHVFEAESFKGVLKNGDDILNTDWFDLNKINSLKLRGEWVKDVINYFIVNK